MPRTFGKQSTNMDTNRGYTYAYTPGIQDVGHCKGTVMDEAELT